MKVFNIVVASLVVFLVCVIVEVSSNSAARAVADSDDNGQVSTVLVEDRLSPRQWYQILQLVIRFIDWVRELRNRNGRITGDPHVTFGDPDEPADYVCYNMGGEEGVRYDLYTHDPTALMIVGRMAIADNFTFIDQVEVFIESYTFTFSLDDMTDATSAVIRWGSVYEFILPYSGHVKGFARQNHFEVLVAGYKFEVHKSSAGALTVVHMDGDIARLDGLLGRIHTYSLEGNSTEIDAYAALKLNHNVDPILVQKIQHPHGECWKHIQIGEVNEITGDMSVWEH